MAIFGDFLRPVFAASREHNISDLHSKFALGPRHVYQIPNYLLKDKRLAEVAYPCACSQCRKSLYGSISQTRLSCMSKLPGRCALICAPAEIRRHPSIMRHSFSSLSVDSAQLDVTRCDSADAGQSCAIVRRWPFFCCILRPVFPASRVQHISDLHSKFALRPHHV